MITEQAFVRRYLTRILNDGLNLKMDKECLDEKPMIIPILSGAIEFKPITTSDSSEPIEGPPIIGVRGRRYKVTLEFGLAEEKSGAESSN